MARVVIKHGQATLTDSTSPVVGLRFFNAYGAREQHKKHMASMVYQAFRQLTASGVAWLYQGTGRYGDGEQRRDFVHVSDVVRVSLAAADGFRSGVADVGTGNSRSFNEVVGALTEQLGFGRAEYIPMNPALLPTYQSFSQADTAGLLTLGLPVPQISLAEGVAVTMPEWQAERHVS